MDKKSAAKLPPRSELELLNKALSFLHHRNRNQHHRSPWWKHMNIFRRQLRLITARVHESNPNLNSKKPQLLAPLVILHTQGEERLKVWVEFFIVQWYRAFSQILAERRFVGIGLVLLAILARACAILGATKALMEHGQEQLVQAMAEIDDPTAAESGLYDILKSQLGIVREEDLGEVVERLDSTRLNISELGEEKGNSEALSSPENLLKEPSTSREGTSHKWTQSQSKRKRKSNPIDALFASLSADA